MNHWRWAWTFSVCPVCSKSGYPSWLRPVVHLVSVETLWYNPSALQTCEDFNPQPKLVLIYRTRMKKFVMLRPRESKLIIYLKSGTAENLNLYLQIQKPDTPTDILTTQPPCFSSVQWESASVCLCWTSLDLILVCTKCSTVVELLVNVQFWAILTCFMNEAIVDILLVSIRMLTYTYLPLPRSSSTEICNWNKRVLSVYYHRALSKFRTLHIRQSRWNRCIFLVDLWI